MSREQKPSVRLGWKLLPLAIVLTAGGLWVVLRAGHGPAQTGRVAATTRVTVDLGGHHVAVVEPGGRLEWSARGDGSVRVEQHAGDVFYRVEHGRGFTVATPAGEVRDAGTCFRVEVDATPALRVSVYEGRVLVHNPHGHLELGPGERGEARAGGAPGRAP